MHKCRASDLLSTQHFPLLLQLKMAGFYGTKLISPGSRWCPDGFFALLGIPKVSNLLLEVKKELLVWSKSMRGARI